MTKPTEFALLLTCEHGGNELPLKYRSCFASRGAQLALKSHRGFDPGALHLAESLAERLGTELYSSSISRLLIDLNRSEGSTDLFSQYSDALKPSVKDAIVSTIYAPFRKSVASSILKSMRRVNGVVHLSVHTFTPKYRGTLRKYDIGVLFDPSRSIEARMGSSLLSELTSLGFEVRANEPYLGTDDGHTTELRKHFPESQYVGIELEVNNRFAKFASSTKEKWAEKIANAITRTLP